MQSPLSGDAQADFNGRFEGAKLPSIQYEITGRFLSNPPFRTTLPPMTARRSGRSFEIRSLELRMTGTINHAEKLAPAQNDFIQEPVIYPVMLNSFSKNLA
jgi:hypothetical protein